MDQLNNLVLLLVAKVKRLEKWKESLPLATVNPILLRLKGKMVLLS